MIAKVSTGRSFGGTVRYLYEGHQNSQEEKRAELLDYNGIRPGKDEMIKDFDRHRWLNPDLGNAVGHVSISYHPQDSHKITSQAMIQHARQFMEKMGIDPEETQWALIRHRDRRHEHFHLVYNRVDYNGQTISDAHNYKRSHEATRAIALEHGLTVAAEKKKDLTRTTTERLPGHDQARYKIYETLQKEVSQVTSIEQLRQALKTQGIETIVQKKGQGISFKIGDHAFKASEVDRAYTGSKIHSQIERNRQIKAEKKQRAANVRSSHQQLNNYRHSRNETNSQQAEQAQQRATNRSQKPSLTTDLKQAFEQLAEKMKERDLQKAFGQLAEKMKERDLQNRQKEQDRTKQQTTKRDQSKGLGL